MTNGPRNPDDALSEEIVAYLDGELSAAQCEAIESRIASDDRLRERVQGFDRVWNALDDLPRPAVGDAFAKSTIEMVAVEAGRDAARFTAALPAARRRRGYAFVAACAASALVGFLLVRAVTARGDRFLVEKLPVIYQVDTLEAVGDVDFLRRLNDQNLTLLAGGAPDRVEDQFASWRTVIDGGRSERAAWVASLDEAQKSDLLDAARRYASDLSAARRDRVETTFEEIVGDRERDELLRSALAYQSWLATRTASEQSRLRQLSTDDRLGELRREHEAGARRPTPAESVALREAIRDLAGAEEVERAIGNLKRLVRRFGEPAQERRLDRQRPFPVVPILFLASIAEGRPPLNQRGPLTREVQRRAAADWEVIEGRLLDALGPEKRERIRGLETASDRRRVLRGAVVYAVRDAPRSFDTDAYFASDSLTDAKRHELLALPTDQMQRSLRLLYLQEELGGIELGDLDRWMRFAGDRPPGEGPPPFPLRRGRRPDDRGAPRADGGPPRSSRRRPPPPD